MFLVDSHKGAWPEGVARELHVPRQSLAQNLIDSAAKFGSRQAIVFHGAEITYDSLLEQVEQLAGYLQSIGVKKGEPVLLFMQNSPQHAIAYYAILRADAVIVPVNPMSRLAEMEYLVEDTGAKVIIAGSEVLPFVTPLAKAGKISEIIAGAYAEMADPEYDLKLPEPLASMSEADCVGDGVTPWSATRKGLVPTPITAGANDLAVIPYSSGTTGKPKGCVHTHYSVMVTLVGGLAWNPMSEEDVSLATLPFFHVTGMQSSLNCPLAAGGTIVIMARWQRGLAAELIRRYRVTRWRSISTMAIDLVNDPKFDTYDLSSLDGIGGGGAAMPAAVAKTLKELTGLDYVEGYGLSEMMAATHINPPNASKRQCLGIPVFGVDARILDLADDHECGPNEPGEIVMNAPQAFQGYWQRPEATAEAFIEIDGKPFFRTGDIAYYDEMGYFFMVDRVKRMINASGFKVWPAEVEAMMHQHPEIAEACVIAAKDVRRGETVKAFVVARDTARGTISEASVISWCRENMATYKCPTQVEIRDELPKSGAGKVLWRTLMEEEAGQD